MRIIFLPIFMMLVGMLSAQTLADADFNDGTLGGFKAVDVDGLTPHQNVADYGQWTVGNRNEEGTDKLAVVTSWYDPAGQADDWLISPKVTIPEEGFRFLFDVISFDSNYPDGYQVLVSTTDDEIASFTDVILDVPRGEAKWNKVDLLLDAYVGKSIHIAIRNNSNDQYLLAVDDVKIVKLAAIEAALTNDNYRWQLSDAGNAANVTVENKGANTIETATFEVTVGDQTETVQKSGLSIETFQTENLELALSELSLQNIGDAKVMVKLIKINGVDVDYSTEYAVTFQSENAKRKMVAEEATGTWCGFCPRGAYFLEEMERAYGEDFIGIAVHGPDKDNDPMTIAGYANTLGFTGYPTIRLNRDFDAPDFKLDSIANLVKSKVVPVDIEVKADYNKEDNKVYISGTLDMLTDASNVDISVIGVITENGVTGTGDGYNQANYFAGGELGPMNGYENLPNPVPAADMVYNEVARAVIGNEFAYHPDYLFTALDKSATKTIEMTYEVAEGVNKDSLHAAILVIDRTSGQVLNGDDAVVAVPNSVNDLAFEGLFDIAPNPAVSDMTITIGAESVNNAVLEVIDINGRVLDRVQVGSIAGTRNVNYNVSSLENGMYIVKLTADNQVASQKLTVLK